MSITNWLTYRPGKMHEAERAEPPPEKSHRPGFARICLRRGFLIIFLLLFLAQTAAAQPIVIDTISFGGSRAGVIVANPTNNHIYAAQEDVPAIAVIDGSTNTIINTISTSGFHTGSDVNPATNFIYLAQQFAGSVKIIDGSTDTVVTDLSVPGLNGTIGDLAINPTTNRLYVIRADNNDLAVFDAATNTLLTSIPLNCPSGHCTGVAVNPLTNRIYVAATGGDQVHVIDGGTDSVIATVPVGDSPLGSAVNPTTNLVYVSNISDNTVSVIDGATNMVITSIPVGTSPVGISINPTTNRIYVTNNSSNDVSIIDGSSNTVVATVPVGAQPNGITVMSSANRIYVSNDTGHSVSVIEDLTDTTPPIITPNVSGTLGNNDWYVTDVAISWAVSDDESSISSTSGCDATAITTDTAGTTLTCEATSAGGTASASITIKRDATPPSISGGATPLPNGNGWNNSDVAIMFTCADNLSSVATCGPNQTLSSDGANQSVTGTATDNAGNNASTTVSGINLDKTPPTVSVTGVTNGATYSLGQVPAGGCDTQDSLSGVATQATFSLSGGNANGAGSFTATCSGANDNAGNSNSASVTYQVVYNFNGFFAPVDNPPVVNSVKAGQAIPVKFSLSGNQGLDIFASGYPKSQSIACDLSGGVSDVEETVNTGNNSLTYDLSSDQYSYIWKSKKEWAKTCRQLVVWLNDGNEHIANFNFK